MKKTASIIVGFSRSWLVVDYDEEFCCPDIFSFFPDVRPCREKYKVTVSVRKRKGSRPFYFGVHGHEIGWGHNKDKAFRTLMAPFENFVAETFDGEDGAVFLRYISFEEIEN